MDGDNTSQFPTRFLSEKCYGVTLDINLNAEKTRHRHSIYPYAIIIYPCDVLLIPCSIRLFGELARQ